MRSLARLGGHLGPPTGGGRARGRADVLRRAARTQRQASSGGRSVRVRVDLPAGGRSSSGSAPWRPIVVVIVPGSGRIPPTEERLADTATRMWDHMAGHVDRSDDVAVVSWLGYDPPTWCRSFSTSGLPTMVPPLSSARSGPYRAGGPRG